MQDDEQVALLVSAHVPSRPYWLVSIKPADENTSEEIRYHKVDDRLGQVLPEILL